MEVNLIMAANIEIGKHGGVRIRLPRAVVDELKAEADVERRSPSNLVRVIVEQWLEDRRRGQKLAGKRG